MKAGEKWPAPEKKRNVRGRRGTCGFMVEDMASALVAIKEVPLSALYSNKEQQPALAGVVARYGFWRLASHGEMAERSKAPD